jgi:hypothetical protein
VQSKLNAELIEPQIQIRSAHFNLRDNKHLCQTEIEQRNTSSKTIGIFPNATCEAIANAIITLNSYGLECKSELCLPSSKKFKLPIPQPLIRIATVKKNDVFGTSN